MFSSNENPMNARVQSAKVENSTVLDEAVRHLKFFNRNNLNYLGDLNKLCEFVFILSLFHLSNKLL